MQPEQSTTLLLVEDEAIVALAQRRTLERNGYTVAVAHSGEAAVAYVSDHHDIGLILMDIDLGPEMDGTEASRRILEFRDVPIVFLTSHTEPEYVDRVKEITGYGYVVKSSGEFVLLESIDMALKLWRAHRQSQEEKERYRLITENMSETVLTVDRALRMNYVSPSIERLTGFTPDEYRRLTLEETFTGESAGAVAELGRRQSEDPAFEPPPMELERRRSDGSTVWTETASSPIVSDDGEVIGFVATIREITERIRHRSTIEASNARYRSIVENTNDALIVHDFNGVVTLVNAATERLLGYSGDQLIGMNLSELHAESSRQRIGDVAKEGRWSERIVVEQEMLASDGRRVPVEVSAVIASHEGAGEVHSFLRDLRGRQESETAFRAVYDQTEESISVLDARGRFLQANRAAAAKLGLQPSDLRGRPLHDVYQSRFVERAMESIRAVFESGRSRHGEWETAIGGENKWFLVHIEPNTAPDGTVTSVTTFSTDITELKHAQDAYRLIAEHASDVVGLLDGDLQPIYLSPSANRLFGYGVHDFDERSIFDAVHDEDVDRLRQALHEAIRDRVETGRHEFRVVTGAGEVRWTELLATHLFDEDGELERIIVTARDITSRAKLDAQLRETTARLDATLSAMPELVFELDSELRFCEYRKPAQRNLYVAPEDFLGRSIDDVLPREAAKRVRSAVAQVSEGHPATRVDYSLPGGDGERFFRASLARHDTRGANASNLLRYVVVVHEVTDFVRAHEELRAALEHNRWLIREVHHRVKNNLSIISSLIFLTEEHLPEGVDLSELRNQIEAVRFAHEHLQSVSDEQAVDVEAYLRGLLSTVLGSASSYAFELQVEAEGITLPGGHAVSLGLIANELASNAAKHGFTPEDENRFTVELTEADDDYTLRVSNSGRPFPDDVDPRTTTSLGLQLVVNLVDQLGGELELARHPHPVFTIRFPEPAEAR